MDFNMGQKVKQLRKLKGLSILQLSEVSGVSTGLISQIERDLVVPTVVSIWRIAKALDTNIGFFFENIEKKPNIVIKKGQHKLIITNNGNSTYQILSPYDTNHIIDFVKVTLKGGQTYEREELFHEGEECGYVLKGTLTLQLNGEYYEVEEGDSVYFESTIPHKYINLQKEECISIWAMTPLFFNK